MSACHCEANEMSRGNLFGSKCELEANVNWKQM